MEDSADIDMRCSVIAFKGDNVLLVHRQAAAQPVPAV